MSTTTTASLDTAGAPPPETVLSLAAQRSVPVVASTARTDASETVTKTVPSDTVGVPIADPADPGEYRHTAEPSVSRSATSNGGCRGSDVTAAYATPSAAA